MPWVEAELRGQRVLARARDDGSLATDTASRVEIRYKPGDSRAYRAAARNLVVADGAKLLSDDACPPAAAGAPSARDQARKAQVPDAPPGAWIAYTDGACSGNPGPAGSGVVLVSPEGVGSPGTELEFAL